MIKYIILIVFFLLVSVLTIKKIRNLTTEEQDQVKKELQNPFSILIVATPYVGILLVFIGAFLELAFLMLIGIVFMLIGVIIMFFLELRQGNTKQAIEIIILNIVVIVYIYLFMYRGTAN